MYGVSLFAQVVTEQFQNVVFVINDQDGFFGCHLLSRTGMLPVLSLPSNVPRASCPWNPSSRWAKPDYLISTSFRTTD